MLFTNYKKMLSSLRADRASLNWQWFEVHWTKVYGLYEQQWRVLVHVSSATRTVQAVPRQTEFSQFPRKFKR